MQPFLQLRLLLFRITLIVSNLRLCEQFCIIFCRVFGFSPLVFTGFGEKKKFYLLTANKCGLNQKPWWRLEERLMRQILNLHKYTHTPLSASFNKPWLSKGSAGTGLEEWVARARCALRCCWLVVLLRPKVQFISPRRAQARPQVQDYNLNGCFILQITLYFYFLLTLTQQAVSPSPGNSRPKFLLSIRFLEIAVNIFGWVLRLTGSRSKLLVLVALTSLGLIYD
jgi:hypothetical protein